MSSRILADMMICVGSRELPCKLKVCGCDIVKIHLIVCVSVGSLRVYVCLCYSFILMVAAVIIAVYITERDVN